jgi:exopolyphosphatase/pppGpp-phosphohydrolase
LRLLEKLTPPPGWTPNHLKIAGLAARYQSGSLPSDSQKSYAGLKRYAKKVVDVIGGVLRLAEAFDFDHRGSMAQIVPQVRDSHLLIEAAGYDARSRSAEKIAAARHLLENICKVPIMVNVPADQPRANS